MNVIFIKDLKGQGKKGEVKKVKDGYGQNFLIKNGYAVLANESNIKHLNTQNKKKAEEEKEHIKECEKYAKKIENITLIFKVKVGANGKVFGSVSSKQILNELKNKGIEIDKKNINIADSITALGTHIVKIELHKEVTANLKVEVKQES